MKVLFLQNIEGIGGSENYLIRLLPGLKKAGVECEMLSVIPDFRKGDQGTSDDFREKLEQEGIPVHEIYTSSFISPVLIWKIRRLYIDGGFDLIHSHLIYADFWAAWVKILSGKRAKVVSTKHGYQEKIYSAYSLKPASIPRNLYYMVFAFAERQMDYSYACSRGLSHFLQEAGLVKNLPVVEHGFEYPAAGKQLENLRYGTVQLVLPGRLIYRKGHDLFLKIFPALVKRYPGIKAVVIGEGADREAIYSLVEEAGLEEDVLFRGFQDNVIDWMAASDVVVVPSRSEGLPLVIMEGFQSGTPVVAFDVPGCRDALEDGETGRLVPAFELDKFQAAIEQILDEPDDARRMAVKAKKALADRFSFDRMVRETKEVYDKVLSS